ncbi:hypothetical protein GUJ93_ZPchr0013g37535 [Zizania palustris]|uniref:Uncharacterized protein n=1 Tax=Zizania palustris TaxID=103762 RepID=A0A8J6C3D1_ZIZPA|nr:hypothetical protein GUJ93_ZPchr0013g37535 [Zizania palustris]
MYSMGRSSACYRMAPRQPTSTSIGDAAESQSTSGQAVSTRRRMRREGCLLEKGGRLDGEKHGQNAVEIRVDGGAGGRRRGGAAVS